MEAIIVQAACPRHAWQDLARQEGSEGMSGSARKKRLHCRGSGHHVGGATRGYLELKVECRSGSREASDGSTTEKSDQPIWQPPRKVPS